MGKVWFGVGKIYRKLGLDWILTQTPMTAWQEGYRKAPVWSLGPSGCRCSWGGGGYLQDKEEGQCGKGRYINEKRCMERSARVQWLEELKWEVD